MADDYIIGIGTVGAGLWLGYVEGQKWRHVQHGPPIEGNCRALAVDPRHPGTIWAGADRVGMFRSTDHGATWSRVGNPIGKPIWSIGLDPHDDQRLYLGTSPGIHRTKDGGESFHELTTSISAECPIGLSRTTNVVVDPTDADVVWATVEVDGVHRSADRGETWAPLGRLGPDDFHNDLHGFAMMPTAAGCNLLVTTPFGLGRSADHGASFDWRPFDPFPGSKLDVAYSRCVQAPWQDVVVVCVGDFVPGRIGALEISPRRRRDVEARAVAGHTELDDVLAGDAPGLDGTIVASSLFGQVYVSDDRAATWRKLGREFGEIRSVVVTPAA